MIALRLAGASIAFAIPCLMAQNAGNEVGKMRETQTLVEKARLAAAAQNAFGMRLLADEAAHGKQENVFLSPLSVFLALGMTENGAAGETQAAMRHTLDVPAGASESEFQESASALSKSLRAQKNVVLLIANALWSDPSLPMAEAFVRRCRELYDADVTALDFHKPGAAGVINDWVKEKTHDKIPAIVTPDAIATAKAVLTNAVYFQGQWRRKFNKNATQDGIFHLTNGKQKNAPFMHNASLPGAYHSGDGFEAAELPYESSSLSLLAILPAAGTTPEQALANVKLDALLNSSEPFDLDLKLPRFTMDFSASLKEPLERMGMGIAFQFPGADFAPLGSPLSYIGDVLHKTRLEVDEEGTVAAAATAVIMRAGSVMLRAQEKKTLVFDRPFAVLLCDHSTGAILFAGLVHNP